MNGSEFKQRLRILGRTQIGFATEIGVTERTVHNWTSKGPPSEICYLIETMTSLEMPFGPKVAVARNATSEREFTRSVARVMDRLAEQAVCVGAEHAFVDAVRNWIGGATSSDK
ncbi:hypothetical protein [Methylobacterium sp. 1030]|uniref:hypothetical protein n=1 Tax=Methylobacterium sp. 1030 TaxID=3156404 RepID=UPI0033963B67